MAEPFFFKLAGEVWAYGDGILLDGEVDLVTGKKAASAMVELADPQLELANRLPLPTRDTKIPFELFVGAGRSPSRLFSGFLSSLEPEWPPGRLKLMAVDKLKNARRRKVATSRASLSIEQLGRRIAKEYDIKLDTSRATLKELRAVGRVLQHGETDFELLERLCELAGHSVYVSEEALEIIDDAASIASGEEVLRLRLGEQIRGPVKFKLVERTSSTTSRITDYKGEVYERGEEEDGASATQVVRHVSGVSKPDADTPSFSDGAIESARKSLMSAKKVFEASVTVDLALAAKPHQVVTLEGYGARFDGAWRIDRAKHRLKPPQTTQLDIYNGGAK